MPAPETDPAPRPHQPDEDRFHAIRSEEVVWKPFPAFPPAARLAILVGDPTKPGPYVIRVHLPDGTKMMPHKHPEDRIYTVISGVFYIGLGETFDEEKLTPYPPGSVVILPGGQAHFHWAKAGEYTTQVSAIGPLGLAYVDPANDPRGPAAPEAGKTHPAERAYPQGRTAYLLVDPYNDFLSEGGKLFPMIKPIATEVGLLDNLRALDRAVRAAGVPVFIVPHRRWEPGDYEDWDHPNPSHQAIMKRHTFARGEWGGDWHPDFAPRPGDTMIQEHWGQSGFANTDLDLRLKQRRITHVIVVGLLANTCIESTARFAMELGYHVTLVRDATAAFRPEMMHAAHELNGPTFAHAILTTQELIAAL